MIQLKNNSLEVDISERGAEIVSIKASDGYEFLWQAENEALPLKAPILFPFTSFLYQSKYAFQGNEYEIPFLGFVHFAEMNVMEQSDERAVFSLTSTPETKAMYPFDFAFRVIYQLQNERLQVSFEVENTDTKTMYFSLGWHPTFYVPMENSLSFDDYKLTFDTACTPSLLTLEPSEGGVFYSDEVPFSLEDQLRLPLTEADLQKNGIMTALHNVSKSFTIQSDKGNRSMSVSYPDMNYLILFHYPGLPFLTTEGWTSRMGRNGVIEDIEKWEEMLSLPKGEVYTNHWEFIFR